MKVKEILEQFGNIEIPKTYLIQLGLIEADRLVGSKEFTQLTGIKAPHKTIARLKHMYGLTYDESKIPMSILRKHYGLEKRT